MNDPTHLPLDAPFSSKSSNINALISDDKLHTPQFDLVDITTIDFILISNFWNIGALPYLTEYYGFEGKIFATVPTIQQGKQLLLELVNQRKEIRQTGQMSFDNSDNAFNSKTLERLWQMGILDVNQKRPLYTEKDIESCFAKIRSCSFDEDMVSVK